jgi:hypothetical protein
VNRWKLLLYLLLIVAVVNAGCVSTSGTAPPGSQVEWASGETADHDGHQQVYAEGDAVLLFLLAGAFAVAFSIDLFFIPAYFATEDEAYLFPLCTALAKAVTGK